MKAILVTLFVIGCFSTLYYVYFVMPEQVLAQVNYAVHQEAIEKVRVAVQPVLGLILIEVLLAVAIIILNRKSDDIDNTIIYVDKYREKEKEEEKVETQDKSQLYEKKYSTILEKLTHTKEDIFEVLISEICTLLNASAGAVFTKISEHGRNYLEFQVGYAYQHTQEKLRYQFGEGITGQVAKNKQFMVLENVPEGYIQVFSGLGKIYPSHLLVMPMLDSENNILGVIELASFQAFTTEDINFVEKLSQEIDKITTSEIV